MRPSALLLVALGGAIGSTARYAVTMAATRMAPSAFPVGTLAVNSVGCFLIGLIVPFMLAPAAGEWRVFLVVGVLGGFTTFSAFSLETFTLLRDGRPGLAALNVAGSVVVGLLLTWAGWRLARLLGSP